MTTIKTEEVTLNVPRLNYIDEEICKFTTTLKRDEIVSWQARP